MVVQNSLSTHPGTPANTLAHTYTHTHTSEYTHNSGPALSF